MSASTLPEAFQAALRLAARDVVEDALDLRGALARALSILPGRRPQDRLHLWQALPAAVLAHQALFARADYSHRRRRTAVAACAAASRFQTWQPRLLGAAAAGLAADDGQVELALHLDEDETLLRWCFEQPIRVRVSERQLAQRVGAQERRCTTICYAEAQSDVELVLLPLSWLGRPLYTDGLPLATAVPAATSVGAKESTGRP